MTIPVTRMPYDRLAVLENELMLVNEERIRQATFITQFIAMRALQVRCHLPHSPLVRQQRDAAEDAVDDEIDRLTGRVTWPQPMPDLITQEGGEW